MSYFPIIVELIPGVAATDLGKTEDAAHSSGDTGVMILAVRKDTAAALAGSDADYIPLIVNASGRLYTSATVDAALPAGSSNIGDVDIASITAGTNTIGGTLDAGASWTQVFGVAGVAYASADATASPAVTDAPTSGQKLVIDDIFLSVGATAMQVDFEIETAGTHFLTFYCAANTVYQFTPRAKFKLPTADKKLLVDASVAGNISVTVFYHSEA